MNSEQSHLESDVLDGASHPRLSSKLIGHKKAFQTFYKCQLDQKLHHAWILSGPRGIGKATLAWKIVAELANESHETKAPMKSKEVIRQKIAALSLSNLFLCRRPYDEKVKRLKKFITIDEIRKLKSFFQMSAIENEWRVAIVDCADELNKSAANALLKLLEEPPNKSILLIVSNQPGRLSATLRSRCRSLHLNKLSASEIEEVLSLSNYDIEQESVNDRLILSIIADGSVGIAITAINQGGILIYKDCLEILAEYPNFDRKKILKLAETVRNNAEKFKFLSSIILLIIARLALLTALVKTAIPTLEEKPVVKKLANEPNIPEKLANLYYYLSKLFLSCEELNLDTTNQIFNSFINIEKNLIENRNE